VAFVHPGHRFNQDWHPGESAGVRVRTLVEQLPNQVRIVIQAASIVAVRRAEGLPQRCPLNFLLKLDPFERAREQQEKE
jgi:hypothetical protein